MMNTSLSACSPKPLAITVCLVTTGGLPSAIDSSMRSTVALFTTGGSSSGGPTSKPVLLTNSVAVAPLSITAMLPQGPLMFGPAMVPATLPCASSTIRQPWPLVFVVPSWLGRLPTMTQPDFSMVIAVVRPTPPGHCGRLRGIAANRSSCLRRGCVVDDGGAEALQIVAVVEVVDQHVVLPGSFRP